MKANDLPDLQVNDQKVRKIEETIMCPYWPIARVTASMINVNMEAGTVKRKGILFKFLGINV